MDIIETFLGVICALIVKDMYDIFIANHIKTLLSNYKKLVTKINEREV